MLTKKLVVSRRHQRRLREVIVDEHGPGTALHDFKAFLTFVDEHEFVLTETHQIPRPILPEINARLALPLQHGLAQPHQKSYPHIHGLYLLLRASGLTVVLNNGSHPILVVDDQARASWDALNPTERYLTLLETWLLRGYPEIIGEGSQGTYEPRSEFTSCVRFFLHIPKRGLRVSGQQGSEELLRHGPGRHHLGLLELFGLIRVQHGPPERGCGWRIMRIERTAFGEALLALLHCEFFNQVDDCRERAKVNIVPIGSLQPVLQPHFPAWQRNLALPGWTFRKGVHIFEVSREPKSHRVAIPAQSPLDHLAAIIVHTFKFDPGPFYRFSYRDRFGVERHISHPALEEEPLTDAVPVGEVPLHVGQCMVFLFDFGACWRFKVTLRRVDVEMEIEEPAVLRE